MRRPFWLVSLSLMTLWHLYGQTANHIVISEVYGGGGNSGSTWKNDFIELYNPTNGPVDLGGWSVQYSSATQSTWQVTPLQGTIQPKGYYLIKEAQGTGGTQDLPSPDVSGTISMSGTNGEVALVRKTSAISGKNDPDVVDFIGYGSGSQFEFEGSAAAPALTNTTSAERKASAASTAASLAQGGTEEKAGNGWDSDNNANDFVAQSTINPQNSASPKEPISSALAGIGSAAVVPSVLKVDTALSVSLVIRGSAAGTITNIKIPHAPPFDWTGISVDVDVSGGAPGTAVLGADTLLVRALTIGANDSVLITIGGLSAPDTTLNVTFRIETGAGSDSTAPISSLPRLLLYGSPRPIAEMRVNDSQGVPVNLQKLATVRGIVTVSDQFGSPGFLQDASGGIAIYDNVFVNTVRIGDEVTLTGTVTQFNGLTELENVTLHQIHSSGNDVTPVIVTASQIANDGLNGIEIYEGVLVQLNRVSVRDTLDRPIATWQVLPGYSGANYRLRDSSGTCVVLIDKDVYLADASAPSSEFDIVAVVGQFVPVPPYVGGYQLQPRSRLDVLSSGPLIIVQPYESDITATSLRINWGTATSGSSFVTYRSTRTSEVTILGDTTKRTLHAVTLSGLLPATTYDVQVFSVSGADTSYSNHRIVSTASQGSSGAMNVYFNKSVNVALAQVDTAKGNSNLLDQLLQRINAAQKSIDCALYSISGSVGQSVANALVQAKNRGVSVRLIIEKDNLGGGTGTTIYQRIAPAGIPWIADNFDAVNAGAGLHHNKFLVFDYRGGTADKIWVWTGSWNLTDPGTADDMQNAIEIQDEALAGAYTLEFNEMWGSESETPSALTARFGARKRDNTPHVFNIGGTPVELYFSPSDRTTSAIMKTVSRAQHSVNVALLTFTRSDIASTLTAKKDGGLKVRVLLDNNADIGTQFGFLTSAGIEVRLDPCTAGLLHHKYAVVDAELNGLSQYVITGSHNWTNSAENSNNENTLIIQSNRIANQYLQEFAARYKEAGGTDNIVVRVTQGAETPEGFGLWQNYPNPFNGMTNVEFRIANFEFVRLKVFDVLGREVAVLINEQTPRGNHRVIWNASSLPSGTYFYQLQASDRIETKKMMLLK